MKATENLNRAEGNSTPSKTTAGWLKTAALYTSLLASPMVLSNCGDKGADPKPKDDPIKVDEPKYVEWSYEAGKDPLPIQLFTFPTGANPVKSFDIGDTTKVEDVFAGHLEGTDYLGKYHNLDMTKNSWDDQIFPGVPVDVGGYEFSAAERDMLFTGVKLTNSPTNNILTWASANLTKVYNEKIKPQLDRKNAEYFKKHGKKPKYQVSMLTIPLEYYESGFGGTVMKMSDGNIVVLAIEPLRSYGTLESILGIYGSLGHEFAGHGMNEISDFVNDAGKTDQYNNSIDGSGHINNSDKTKPRFMLNGTTADHFRNDHVNNSMIFPESNREFYSARDSETYADLKLKKTSAESSSVPYIANMVAIKQARGKEWMKNMWTDKQLITKNGKTSAEYVPATIVSIQACDVHEE